MMLGLTYAQFVGVIGTSIILGPTEPTDLAHFGKRDVIVSFGANSANKSGPGQSGFVTATLMPHDLLFERFTPIYAVGVSVDGALFTSAGIGKRFNFFGIDVTPHWSPTLYQRDISKGFSQKELLQFRTGFDISYRLSDNFSFNGGFYHISNAGITSKSAGIDVTHIGFKLTF